MNKSRFYIFLFLLAMPLKKGSSEEEMSEREGRYEEVFLAAEKARTSNEKTIYPEEFTSGGTALAKDQSFPASCSVYGQISLTSPSISFEHGPPCSGRRGF